MCITKAIVSLLVVTFLVGCANNTRQPTERANTGSQETVETVLSGLASAAGIAVGIGSLNN